MRLVRYVQPHSQDQVWELYTNNQLSIHACVPHMKERGRKREVGEGEWEGEKIKKSDQEKDRSRKVEVYKRELFVIHSTNDYHLLTQTHLR